jgi:hypothetical protein
MGFYIFIIISLFVSLLMWLVGLFSTKLREKLLFFVKKERSRLKLTLAYLLAFPALIVIILILQMNNMVEKQQKVATFTDPVTGLMWQDEKYPVEKKNWNYAVAYCEDIDYAGFYDWRLPSYNELFSIVDYRKHEPAIKKGLKNMPSNKFRPSGIGGLSKENKTYWSSSSDITLAKNAWFVNFDYGFTGTSDKQKAEYYIRCVRDK